MVEYFSIIIRQRSISLGVLLEALIFSLSMDSEIIQTRMLAQTVSAFSLSQHMVLDNSILLIFVLCIRLCKKLLENSFSAGD